jgi:hypothetical protein
MTKSRTILAGLVILVIAMLSAPGFASAATNVEGRDGNSVVCGGVSSHDKLMKLVNGAPDSCGHRDTAAIWATIGVTPEVAAKMTLGTVCSSDGWSSQGRQHGPKPSADVAHHAGGSTFFMRPLGVWGDVCYSAWKGHLEDGTQVAILVGCGNGEVIGAMRPTPKPVTPHKCKCVKPSTKPQKIIVVKQPGCKITISNSRGTDRLGSIRPGRSRSPPVTRCGWGMAPAPRR